MRTRLLASAILSLSFVGTAFAAISATQQPIVLPGLLGPTDVDIPFPTGADEEGGGLMILNGINAAVPHTVRADTINLLPEARIVSAPDAAPTVPRTKLEAIRDNQANTVFQPVTATTHTFVFSFKRTVTPTKLSVVLDSGSIGQMRVRMGMDADHLADAFVGDTASTTIALSGERATVVEVTMSIAGGVLKIREMRLEEPRKRILFRAVPKNAYTVVYGRQVQGPIVRDGTLPAKYFASGTLGPATSMQLTDDFDGVPAERDNCTYAWNREQEDRDEDGIGDVCDNCPYVENPGQEDSNHNGIGDVCDDDDHDRVMNSRDNCPTVANPEQQDEDKDGVGNACDTSDDRFSAKKPWLLWFAIAVVITALGVVAGFVLRNTKEA